MIFISHFIQQLLPTEDCYFPDTQSLQEAESEMGTAIEISVNCNQVRENIIKIILRHAYLDLHISGQIHICPFT